MARKYFLSWDIFYYFRLEQLLLCISMLKKKNVWLEKTNIRCTHIILMIFIFNDLYVVTPYIN